MEERKDINNTKPKITGINEGRPIGRIVYEKETETKSAGDIVSREHCRIREVSRSSDQQRCREPGRQQPHEETRREEA